MAKVWQRKWMTATGEQRSAWVADYFSSQGQRHIKTFALKKDAARYLEGVVTEVRGGTHTAPSKSVTVAEAAQDWLTYVANEGAEKSTLTQYRQHVDLHIVPRIGNHKLATLTTTRVEQLRDEWLTDLSRPMAKKVLTSFKSLIKEAQRRGKVAQNVGVPVSIKLGKRKKPLEVGVDIPESQEVRRMIDASTGMVRAVIMVAAFAGLRASELRGLRWSDVDLKHGQVHIRQRADRYREIGKAKSASAYRTVPIAPLVANTLREWKLGCPKGDGGLVFPTTTGTVIDHKKMLLMLLAVEVKAGVVKNDSKPKYTLHDLRHYFASLCINPREKGGLELTPKEVQARMGHASIVMTLDRYGHLFPAKNDGAGLAAAVDAIFAT